MRAPARGAHAPRTAPGMASGQAGDQLARGDRLGRRVAREVLLAQQLDRALRRGHALGVGLPRARRRRRACPCWAARRARSRPSSDSGESPAREPPVAEHGHEGGVKARKVGVVGAEHGAQGQPGILREPASIAASARWACSSSPTPTRVPWARSAADQLPEPAGDSVGAAAESSASDTFQHPSLAHAQHVLVHLQRRPERLLEAGRRRRGRAAPGPTRSSPPRRAACTGRPARAACRPPRRPGWRSPRGRRAGASGTISRSRSALG